ncbi:MAG: protein translocase subunit SecF [Ponticaulis sp.]|nr:protein translocase subunit SecF [Ponticaulis sp.]|tara:strand:+ start:10831 stop:11844 length:1014 start_codon:yes stop_codon:yes gene_type:complete
MLIKRLPVETKVNFMSVRYFAFALSAIALVASIVLVPLKGLNFGIDFAGGLLVEITQPEGVEVGDVRDLATEIGLEGVQATSASSTGTERHETFVIRASLPEVEEVAEGTAEEAESDGAVVDMDETQRLIEALEAAYPIGDAEDPNWEILRRETVGPKVSGELLRNGVLALVVSLVFMLSYIWFRFQAVFSIGAVMALVHDVVLTIGVFSLLQITFDLTTIAALLTIIGYSMNDTVVVYDRVREELRRYKKMKLVDVINLSLNRTLTRTTLTSGTTLLALISIYVLGGEVLRGFSFALIWGVIIGTYSSIFIASALLLHTGLKREPDKVKSAEEAFS